MRSRSVVTHGKRGGGQRGIVPPRKEFQRLGGGEARAASDVCSEAGWRDSPFPINLYCFWSHLPSLYARMSRIVAIPPHGANESAGKAGSSSIKASDSRT